MLNNPLASWKTFFLLSIIFCIGWFAYEISTLDLILQDRLYNFSTCKWMIHRDAPLPRAIFYNGIKYVLGAFGVTGLIIFILSFYKEKLHPHRYSALYFFLCMAIIPLTISSLKSVTNVYCPWDLERYGGNAPYVKVYKAYPDNFIQKGRKPECFPGGHASGGFALFSLFFIAKTRRQRLLSLIPPFFVGGIMGFYQMAKGAHFLGHNITTILLAFLMAQGIYLILQEIVKKCQKKKVI